MDDAESNVSVAELTSLVASPKLHIKGTRIRSHPCYARWKGRFVICASGVHTRGRQQSQAHYESDPQHDASHGRASIRSAERITRLPPGILETDSQLDTTSCAQRRRQCDSKDSISERDRCAGRKRYR